MSIETWNAMFMLLQEDKARAIGVSNYTIGDLQDILQNSKDDSIVVPAVNQVEFHPFLYQNDLLQSFDKS
jgi:diketogulonate reductase-like aldo/keto reductase